MLLDDPALLAPPPPDIDQGQQVERMRKLLAIRSINEWCNLDGFPANTSKSNLTSST